MDKTLETIALEVAQKWEHLWSNDGRIYSVDIVQSIQLALSNAVMQRSVALIEERASERINEFADKAVLEWLSNHELTFPAPSKQVRDAIQSVLDDVAIYRDSGVSATRRLQISVFRLLEGGSSEADVAGQLKISVRQVRALYKSAKKRAESVKSDFDLFFGKQAQTDLGGG